MERCHGFTILSLFLIYFTWGDCITNTSGTADILPSDNTTREYSVAKRSWKAASFEANTAEHSHYNKTLVKHQTTQGNDEEDWIAGSMLERDRHGVRAEEVHAAAALWSKPSGLQSANWLSSYPNAVSPGHEQHHRPTASPTHSPDTTLISPPSPSDKPSHTSITEPPLTTTLLSNLSEISEAHTHAANSAGDSPSKAWYRNMSKVSQTSEALAKSKGDIPSWKSLFRNISGSSSHALSDFLMKSSPTSRMPTSPSSSLSISAIDSSPTVKVETETENVMSSDMTTVMTKPHTSDMSIILSSIVSSVTTETDKSVASPTQRSGASPVSSMTTKTEIPSTLSFFNLSVSSVTTGTEIPGTSRVPSSVSSLTPKTERPSALGLGFVPSTVSSETSATERPDVSPGSFIVSTTETERPVPSSVSSVTPKTGTPGVSPVSSSMSSTETEKPGASPVSTNVSTSRAEAERHATSNIMSSLALPIIRPVKRHTNHVPVHYRIDKDTSDTNILYLGGLFELSGTATSGQSELAAAQLAVDHVNEQTFIPGYRLRLVYNDTKCDPGIGSDAFYDLVYRKPTMIMLLTSSCSEVAKTLGEIVPYWHLLLISFAATTPALSKREKYPTFFRLAAADSSHNQARKTFIQHFSWNTVATFTQDLEAFSLAMNEMATDFEKVNISLRATKSFRPTDDDLMTKMKALKETDARIIVGSFKEDVARQVFCEAYHQKMYGPRYVWMLTGGYSHKWWTKYGDTNCSRHELAAAIDGYFSVESLNSIIGSRTSLSGLTTPQFLEAYDKLGVAEARSAFAQVTYDTVWTVALTLKKTMQYWRRHNATNMTLSQFNYRSGEDMFKTFFNIMGSLEFMGVSGPVSFVGPDRRCITAFKQFQDGREEMVAIFFPENNTLDFKCHGCKPVIWKGGKLPADKYTILIRQELIHRQAFFIVCAVSIFGIILAFFFLGFNLYHRKLKYIKLSSPRLNNVAVIGCVLIYLAVVLLGLDDGILPEAYFPVVCTARAFLLAAGFSLAFGAMFTKTYRVHQIISRAHTGLVKSKMLKDTHLLLIVGILLLLDTFVMSLWIAIDPMHRILLNLTSIPSKEDMDLLYIPQLSTCHSEHLDKWMGALYAYKGLLLLFGMYMAWETRNVKIPALNDSQYIGMNIYNVVLMSITVVVLSSLLSNEPSLSYAVVSALIILSTTGMLLLLFLPKIYAIIMHNGSPVITSSGLTVEANTRRFATDDRKELLYRAEVQNRVYKRELLQLDRDIVRLERFQELSEGNPCLNDVFMYLMPESKVNDTSLMHRHDKLIRPDSVTDSDDVCMELPDISPSTILEMKQKLEKKDSGFHTMSFKNTNFVSAEEERVRGYLSVEEEEVGASLANRRQSHQDGSVGERQSLLQSRRASFPAIHTRTAPWRSDSHLEDVELNELQGATPSSSYHANTWTSGTHGKIEKYKRINILKRELTRIQTELKSLGELECEVSFV